MTQQEQELLNGLISRVNGTELANKDAEAERLLQGALGSNLNALYILCQTVLVQQFAMDNAQRQLTEARAELDRLKQAKPEEHGSFLGNLFGLGKGDPAPHQSYTPAVAPPAVSPSYAPVSNAGPQYGYPQQPPQAYGQPAPSYSGSPMGGGMLSGGGGFLQGAMQTAAGVVAGEFAFRAIEDVFHGFGGGEGRSFGGGTEVVNNYYGNNDGLDAGGGFGDRLRDADGLGGGISSDIEDRRGESQGFFGGSDSQGADFAAGTDTSSNGFDDGSDAGGFGQDDGADSDNGSNSGDSY